MKSSSLSSAALAADAAIAAYLRSLADQRAAALADEASSLLAQRRPPLPRPLVLARQGGSAAVVS